MNRKGAKKKCRQTSTSRPKSSLSSTTTRLPAKRVPLQEYSINLLKSPSGTLATGTSSLTGLSKKMIIGSPYASTSHYLRQLVLSEAETQLVLAETVKQSIQGSPTYKKPEEYYDEVIALKKQIQDLMNENAILKFKTQRTEEEYFMKKQRDAGLQYMNSTQVEQTLHQRLANLEQIVRDKDVALSNLQRDLKTTKVEEMKVKLDVYLDEIRRLKKHKVNRMKKSSGFAGAIATEETLGRTRTLMTTLRKMGTEKARLIQENKLLKRDLQRCMEEQKDKLNRSEKFEGQTRTELLSTVAKLQQKIEKLESSNNDHMSVRRLSAMDTEDKLALEGGLTERLDQLDKRETELLEEVSKKATIIAQLKEDRTYYREKCAAHEREVKHLRKEIDELQVKLSERHGNSESIVHQRTSVVSGRQSPRASSISSRQSRRSSRADGDQPVKVEAFRRNRAAKVIQRGWRQHARDFYDEDEEIELIQSTLRGNHIRRLNQSRLRGFMAEENENGYDDLEDSDEDAVEKVQSAVKGHRFRSLQLSRQLSNASSIQSSPSRRSFNLSSIQSPRNSYHRPSSGSVQIQRELEEDRYPENSMRSYRIGSARSNLKERDSDRYSAMKERDSDRYSAMKERDSDRYSAMKERDSDRYSAVSTRTSIVSGRLTAAGHTKPQLSGRYGSARPLNSVADSDDDDDDITLRSSRRGPIF